MKSKVFMRVGIAAFFSLLGLYKRFEAFSHRELWKDELAQLKEVTNPDTGFWRPIWDVTAMKSELSRFPGDYLLTYPFAQIFVTNKWGLIVPHIIATIIGFYLLYLICDRYFKTVWGFMVTFAVVCFNSQLIFHSFEFRPYAVLPTLGLAVFYLSESIVYRADQLNKAKKFLIGAFFTLVVFFHAFGIMIVFFCMLFFAISRLSEKTIGDILRDLLPFSIILALVVIPIFLFYTNVEPVPGTAFAAGALYPFHFIPNPIYNFSGFLKGIFGNLVGFKKFYFLLAGIIIAFLIPHKERLRQIGFFLVIITLPIQLTCLANLHIKYWFLQRQFVWVMPLFAFFLGWSWDSIIVYLANRRKTIPLT